MTRPIVVVLCVHGETKRHFDWREGEPLQCPGGRVLEQAIIIERDENGEWPQAAYHAMDEVAWAAWKADGQSDVPGLTKYQLDALASAQEVQ